LRRQLALSFASSLQFCTLCGETGFFFFRRPLLHLAAFLFFFLAEFTLLDLLLQSLETGLRGLLFFG
jgi:hypothetical protein